MIQLTKGQSADVIVTATEKVTLADPYFLFVFTNPETDIVVKKVFATADDQSPFPTRYNDFTIDVDTLFAGKQEGQWQYQIFEQDNAENTDVTATVGLLETGMMQLNKAVASRRIIKKFNPTPNQIKIFTGE